MMHFITVLYSEIRVSQAGSSPGEAYRGIPNLPGVMCKAHAYCIHSPQHSTVYGVTGVMLIINMKVATPSASCRENTEDPSSTLPGKTRLEFCQHYQPVPNSSIMNLTLKLPSAQSSSCMA